MEIKHIRIGIVDLIDIIDLGQVITIFQSFTHTSIHFQKLVLDNVQGSKEYIYGQSRFNINISI